MPAEIASWSKYLPNVIQAKYEIHDYKHASAILYSEFRDLLNELCTALEAFSLTREDIITPGGNESTIPKKFSDILRPMGWVERKLNAKVIVDDNEISHDTHYVDYIKGRVAFDLEWNSKDQTFDRDLYAFRAFFEYDKISVGVLVTRSKDLDEYFRELGTYVAEDGSQKAYMAKYGASTTHMGKLIPRLESGRNGGCQYLLLVLLEK